MRSLFAKVTTVVAIVAASLVAVGQPAAAGPPRHQPPDLVALGDSFAAGAGNVPYSDVACARSANVAYPVLLARLRLVTLQAFPACSGRTTDQLISQGQVKQITADTDIVTVQALGNDFGFGTLVYYCLDPDNRGLTCHRDSVLPDGHTVAQLLASISQDAPAKLKTLYDAIHARTSPRAKVIIVDYGNPFPDPAGRVGPFCPYMDREELGVAADFANSINAALKVGAAEAGFQFADAAPRFRGLDVCGIASAFYRPAGLGAPPAGGGAGALHPNAVGQGIYAAVLAGRLYS